MVTTRWFATVKN